MLLVFVHVSMPSRTPWDVIWPVQRMSWLLQHQPVFQNGVLTGVERDAHDTLYLYLCALGVTLFDDKGREKGGS